MYRTAQKTRLRDPCKFNLNFARPIFFERPFATPSSVTYSRSTQELATEEMAEIHATIVSTLSHHINV